MGGPNVPDLSGRRFGMLTVISQSVEVVDGKRQSVCHCRCNCGKYVDVPAFCLSRKDGSPPKQQRLSCGCKRYVEDLSGRRIGILSVIRKTGTTPKGGTMYLCRCDCGKEKEIAAYQLASGEAKSCGCLLRERQKSLGSLSAKGVAASHTPKVEAARYRTNHNDGSDYVERTAARLKTALSDSAVFVDGTNVPALMNPAPQGKNPYRGVCWNKRKKSWMAYCEVRKKRWCKCGFKTPEQAKAARDEMQEQMIAESGLEETIEKRRMIEEETK